MCQRVFLLVLIVASLATLAPLPAHAETKVAVLRFAGPQAARLRTGFVANLEQQAGIVLVDQDEITRTQNAMGLRRLRRDRDYARVGAEVGVAAFVEGRVSRRRRRWSLIVRVRSGQDGSLLGTATWGGRNPGALSAVRRNGYERIAEYLELAGESAPAASGDAATTSDRPWYASGRPTSGGPTRVEMPADGDGAGDAEDDERPPALRGDGDDPDEPPDDDDDEEPAADGARTEWFVVKLLGGTLARSMTAEAEVRNECVMGAGGMVTGRSCREPSATGTNIQETRSYGSNFLGHGELGLGVEIYPGALPDGQPVPWLGLVGSFRYGLFLNTIGCRARPRAFDDCTEVDRFEIPTSQLELYVGARGRYRFGEGPSGLEMFADVGYGRFHFGFDIDALKDLEVLSIVPPLEYSYLQVGLGATYGIVPTYFTAGFRFDYRFGLDVGTDAKKVWGVLTSDMSGLLLAIDLRSDAPYIYPGVHFGLTVELFRFTTTYQGQTACLQAGCDANTDPWEPWPFVGSEENVTGGIAEPVDDDYLRLSLVVGYSFR
jgi:hypothetical protein